MAASDDELDVDLPPGFRFKPKDQELLRFFLRRKAAGQETPFDSAIPTLDLFASGAPPPWLLHPAAAPSSLYYDEDDDIARCVAPRNAAEWFYCFARTTPRGSGSRRTTASGTWLTSGGDRRVKAPGKGTVGYKSNLAFKLPGGGGEGSAKWVATHWVMHEFKIRHGRVTKAAKKATDGDGGGSSSSSSSEAEELVLCRIRCTRSMAPQVVGPAPVDVKKATTEHVKGVEMMVDDASGTKETSVTCREKKRQRTSCSSDLMMGEGNYGQITEAAAVLGVDTSIVPLVPAPLLEPPVSALSEEYMWDDIDCDLGVDMITEATAVLGEDTGTGPLASSIMPAPLLEPPALSEEDLWDDIDGLGFMTTEQHLRDWQELLQMGGESALQPVEDLSFITASTAQDQSGHWQELPPMACGEDDSWSAPYPTSSTRST